MIETRRLGRVTVIALAGGAAGAGEEDRDRLLAAVRSAKFVVIDVSRCGGFEWDGLGLLVAARRAHRERWGTHMHLFKVVAPTGLHREMIEAMRVENILAAYRTLDEAMASFPSRRALLVEPDDNAAALAEILLEANGFEVVRVGSPAEASPRVVEGNFDLVLTEIAWSGRADHDLPRRLRIEWGVPIGVMTAAAESAVVGAAFVHQRTDHPARLIERIRTALEGPLHEYYEAIFDSIPAPLLVTSAEGEAARANRAWREWFGLLPLPGAYGLAEAFPGDSSQLASLAEAVSRVGREGREQILEGAWGAGPAARPAARLHLSGLALPGRPSQVLVRVESAPVPAADAAVEPPTVTNEVLFSILEDLDAARVTLANTNEKLRIADGLKDEFVATLSHELRTPLAATMGSLENVLEGFLGPLNLRQQRSLEIAVRNSRRLSRLIGNLLDLSRLERGTLAVKRTRIDVRVPVRNSLEELRPLAERSGIRLRVELPEADVPVAADSDQITQVMVNLLDNALRFSRQEVAVRVTREPAHVLIAVQDDGPGIPPADRERVFERFTVVHSREDKSRTGLGLTIARCLVEAYCGRVWVDDGPGGGACFVVRLPLAEPAAAAESAVVLLPAPESAPAARGEAVT